MSSHNDLLAFMELATQLDEVREKVLAAGSVAAIAAIAAGYGYHFCTDEFLQARKLLLTGRLSWIGHCRLWKSYLQPTQQAPNRLAST